MIAHIREELERTEQGLLESGLPMPHFGSIEGALAKELDEPSAEDLRRDFLQAHMEEIIKCQAMARGHLVRSRMRAKREHWASNEALIAKTQARVRGGLQRRAYQEIMDHYKSAESLAKIVKLQAWLKGKTAGKAYKDLGKLVSGREYRRCIC